jgi:glutamate-1-semialdehyde 2,1-aminomutase
MEKEGYSISEWHDTKEIYEKLNALVKMPVRIINRDAMNVYLEYFNSKCKGSKEMIGEAKNYIPGGVQHNLAFNYPFPIVTNKAEGAYMWDIDGNRYIDFLQAGGPTILGSNYPAVQEKAIEIIKECGPVTGLFHEYELKIAKLVNKHMPSVELFRMLGSGTEGVMAAIRIARLATGRKKVIKIGGAYHGWSDQMVYALHVPGTGRYEAHGIPRHSSEHTQEVAPNNINRLETVLRLNKLRGGTAAVILEPVGPESGTRPVYKEYNKQVRELCDKYGALLIFDEVVTGFRLGLGGAQGYFDVKPDLTVFGKIIAGGYPGAGGVGGRKDLMSHVAAGLESGKKRAYVGGTLAANPLSAAAGYYTILELERTNACEVAGQAGDRLTKGLKQLIEIYRLPFVAYNQGSICHLETTGTMFVKLLSRGSLSEIKRRKHVMEEMGAAYMAEGIITLAGSRMYTSLSDTDEVIDDALNRFERVFRNIKNQ